MSNPETPIDLIITARQRVADRYSSLLHPAILRGEWDKGSLVQGELAKISVTPAMGLAESISSDI